MNIVPDCEVPMLQNQPLMDNQLLFAKELCRVVTLAFEKHAEREMFRLKIADLSARYAHVEKKLQIAMEVLIAGELPENGRMMIIEEFCRLLRD